VTKLTFPPDFHFGVATSAYQIEGALDADGRGESIWDRFCRTPGAIERGEDASVTCDHYHRVEEDLAMVKDFGVTSYRFSIAWPRIQPAGRGAANRKGLAFYDRIVDTLLEAGIRPFPTLYHWDLPQALEDDGGWPARETASRFADYTSLVLRALGDRVTDWSLFNEPSIFTTRGYLLGRYAPGRRSVREFLRSVHVVALAHADGWRAAKAERPNARVGSVFAQAPVEPATDSADDLRATAYADALFNHLYTDPLHFGHYPEEFLAGIPDGALGIEPGDEQRMRAPLDFIGVNCYYRLVVSAGGERPNLPWFLFGIRSDARATGGHADFSDDQHGQGQFGGVRIENAFGRDEGERTEMGWEVWPRALHHVLLDITKNYGGIPIEVCESGCAFNDEVREDGVVHDPSRIAYHRAHIQAVADAIADGANVRSYHAWSLYDNFEWASGFRPRFGLVRVDYRTQERTIKASGQWYREVCHARALL
jgi:beta-glucosidase